MKLKSFRIKNYKSIQDTGEIFLDNSNIAVFAGQNESGKSSVLEALDAFESSEFDEDSIPFDFEDVRQEVAGTYTIEDDDVQFWINFENSLAEEYEVKHVENGDILDISKLQKLIKNFTIIRYTESDNEREVKESVNDNVFQIIKSAVLKNVIFTSGDDNSEENSSEEDNSEEIEAEFFDLSEDNNSAIAHILWLRTPRIVLFNDFCDLLPDKFLISDLRANKKDARGYKAVKNFEKIAKADFLKLYDLDDLKRNSVEEKHNEIISIDFTNVWKQKIHADNKMKLAYKFEKRATEETSFVVFYVETKDKQKLEPRKRSKGLIWFLSFWMELQASRDDNSLIILADEPGLYLHINAQADILAVFEDLARRGHQVLYSTHSPNLIKTDHLERISLVINDEKKGTLIEGITTSKIDSKNKQDALQPVANAIGFSVSGFSLSNKKNVILEGISDYFYYLGMKELLGRKNNYVFVPGIGARKQNTLISFCLGYGVEWVAVFDDDSTRGKDSQNMYREIKENLLDGDDILAEKKMRITNGISCVENMFSAEDMKLIDNKLVIKSNASASVGEKRKVIFAKLFLQKVRSGEITIKKVSATSVDNFTKIFDWIDENLIA